MSRAKPGENYLTFEMILFVVRVASFLQLSKQASVFDRAGSGSLGNFEIMDTCALLFPTAWNCRFRWHARCSLRNTVDELALFISSLEVLETRSGY